MSTWYYILLGLTLFFSIVAAVFILDSLRLEIRRRNRLMDREAWDTLYRDWR